MPNFDGGHYFYTGLAPIARAAVPRADGTMAAPSHILREALATLPNFSQVAGSSRTSPFARSNRTHFARIAVIDDPAYNGRDPGNALRQALDGTDLLEHQSIDHLSRPWLLFEADFDAPDGDPATRDAWAQELWDYMSSELRAIFGHCKGFDAVSDRKGFADYLGRAQIETTMSFNDYWIDPLNIPTLSVRRLLVQALLIVFLFLGAAWFVHRSWGGGWLLWAAAAVLGIGAALWSLYRLVMARGAAPYPTAAGSDLGSVLKSLYLQQRFTRFAVDHQGDDPARLHASFGSFVADHDPAAVERPTQPPGVLRS